MAKFVWRSGSWVNKHTLEPMHKPYEGQVCCPTVQSDIPEYISPVTMKPVVGRAAQREDLKRAGCRLVDPSEHTPVYRNERFARKHGKLDKYDGTITNEPVNSEGYERRAVNK